MAKEKTNKRFLFRVSVLAIFGFSWILFAPQISSAYIIQDLPNTAVKNDFVLGPGKTELFLSPGDSVIKELYITNRLGRDADIVVELEDFTGSRDPNEVVVLLGAKRGPYSLKDYVRPEIMRFTLSHGQKIILPVKIDIPSDAGPGGLYGSVLISVQPPPPSAKEKERGRVGSGTAIISRLGTLFFVRISGDVIENGALKKFDTKTGRRFFEKGPISFEILFENNGSVHLSPFGQIEISNLMGKTVGLVDVGPWFAMPDSLRATVVNWDRSFLFGRYTANLKLERGYGSDIDESSATFWIIPWKFISAGISILILIVLALKWVFSHIEIKRKPKKLNNIP